MKADALMQYLRWKQWEDLALITGPHAGDKAFGAALEAAAVKFGMKIDSSADWTIDSDLRRSAQTEVAQFTQQLGDFDVLVVADELRDFGRYMLYNTWKPRPVVGSEGLVPSAWSPVVEQWGALQLQNRFIETAGRRMQDVDYAAWAAVRSIGEAVTRTGAADARTVRSYLLGDDFELAGFKGAPLTFRNWNGQLRQPIVLAHPRALAAQAPLDGFLHQTDPLDTLGIDAPRKQMRGFQAMRNVLLSAALASMATPTLADEIWVSNEKDDTVSVIDIDTMEVTRTIEVGDRPRGITFAHDYSVLYVCASDSDSVQVLDPDTGEVLHDLPSGEDPEQFVLHPDNRHLYIANEDDAITTVVDTETRKVVRQINVGIEPEGMAVSPDGKIAITTSETTNMAHWIDTGTGDLIANTLVDSRPRHAEFTEDGAELWVSSEIGGTISIFDVETKAEKAKIGFELPKILPSNLQPVGFKFSADGGHAFVALGPANHVAVVNTETYEVEDYILVGRRVWHMAFNGDRSLLFTTNGVSGDVTVVDVAAREAVKTIKVGRFPWGAAYRPTN